MTQLTRSYLRASTDAQDAARAREQVEAFAAEHGLVIAATYTENESGAKLQRPELFRLLGDSKAGDILLVEQIDRLSRLTEGDWKKLRTDIDVKGIRIVSLDLPLSWPTANATDAFTQRMLNAMTSMMLDMLAAIARKDYDDRRRRAAQGIAKAKAAGRYKGRPENVDRNAGIGAMLRGGASWSAIQKATGCSRATISKIARRGAVAAE